MQRPTWFDWITILAILLGPVLALATQRWLDWLREKKKHRVLIYTTLMSLRAQPLHPDHVRALNAIDAIFDRRQDHVVRECWGKVLVHISGDSSSPRWAETLLDLRVDLYQAVGKAVGYDHSIDYIKNRIYTPIAYNDTEGELMLIRKGFAKAMTEDGLKVLIATQSPKEEGANVIAPPPKSGNSTVK